MPNILVVGSINMDVVTRTPRVPRAGETMHCDSTRLYPGGKGANTAVAAARLGARVAMVGAVGGDAFGQSLRATLDAEGIDTSAVATAAAETGTAVILVEPDGQNRILVARGANAHVALPASDRLWQWADAVMLQFEIDPAVSTAAAERAHALGKMVVVDAGPPQKTLPPELMAAADIVSPNETEIESLTGIAVDGWDSAERAAHALRSLGARGVVVKLGGRGSLWLDANGPRRQEAFAVDVVDSTAAGDAYTAALTASLAEGQPPAAALRRAAIAGALTCTQPGAQPSLPTAADLERFEAARAGGK